MEPGTIVYINFGLPPREVVGHEQGMNRPAVVMRDFSSAGLLTVVPLTTKGHTYPAYEVEIPAGEGGLTRDSVALCFQIRTVSTSRITGVMGLVSDDIYQLLWLALNHYLDD